MREWKKLLSLNLALVMLLATLQPLSAAAAEPAVIRSETAQEEPVTEEPAPEEPVPEEQATALEEDAPLDDATPTGDDATPTGDDTTPTVDDMTPAGDDAAEPVSGTCGDGLTWTLDTDTGVLTISGEGAMEDYPSTDSPWCDSQTEIVRVEVGEGVTSIGNYTFYCCTFLEQLTLPESLERIGNYAFRYCTALESITLPEGLQYIGTSAFNGCSGLTKVEIGSCIQNIGSSAFRNCSALTSVYINATKGLVTMNGSPFDSHTDVIWAYVGGSCGSNLTWTLDNTAGILTISGEGDMTSCGWNTRSDSPNIRSVVVESGVTSIYQSAFSGCTALTSIELPETLTSIGYSAFAECSALKDVTLPEGLEELGGRAFYDCTALESVTLPSSLQTIRYSAFCKCASLKAVDLPEGLTSIANSTFLGCTALESITLPDSLQTIGDTAFSGCTALKSIVLPESLQTIGNKAFSDCTGLTEVYIPKNMTWTTGNTISEGSLSAGDLSTYEETATGVFRNCTALTSVTIEEGVTAIPERTFYGCAALTEIHLPKSVTTVGQQAFYGCAALEKAYLDNYFLCVQIKDEAFPETTQLIFATEGEDSQTEVARWYVGAYDETDALAVLCVNGTLVISGTGDVTSKPWWSEYSDCILRVEVQEGITSLPSNAFNSCKQLREVTLGPDVERIRDSAFADCTALTTVTGLENVGQIGYDAFRGCTALTEISLGENLSELERRAFENCTALTTVYWNVSSWNYYYGSNWNVFRNAGTTGEGITLVLGPDVEEIPEYLFFVSANESGQPRLVRVDGTQAAKLWYIGSFAFQNCAQLTQVELGHSLTQIGDGVFNGCSALTALTLPDTLHWIGRKAFYNSGLTGLTLGTGVWEIDEDVFTGCAEGFTIYGYAGSTAQNYAEANDIPFVVLDAPTITINGVAYSMDERVETDTWTYSGDLNDPYLWLYNYEGGGITAEGSLSICCDETSVISGTVDVGQHRLYLYGGGHLTIRTDGDCAVKAGIVEIDRSDTLILQAGTTALAAQGIYLNGEIYLSADGEASDEYDGGSYLRVEPMRWNALFHANGGVWADQTEALRTEECVGEKDLSEISALVSRDGYVLSGWQDAEDTYERRPDDYLPVSAADLVLYAGWTQAGLSLGGQRYTLTAEAQGEGWHFTPATDDSWAVLELSDGYNAGGIFSTGELEVRISGSVTITGGAAQPALEVMGQLRLDVAEDAVVTIQGGSGASAIAPWDRVSLYNHGEMTIRGGDGGAGVQDILMEVYNYGDLSVTGGLRSYAVYDLDVKECTGVITLVAGAGASRAISYGFGYDETIKLYGGKNAAEAVRTERHWYAYVRIQPRTIVVRLDANGGELSGAGLVSRELSQDEQNAFIFACDGQPVRAGYRFVGWNTKIDGTGETYVTGNTYVADDTVDSVTLYAQYEESGVTATQTDAGVQVTFVAEKPECQKLMLAVYDAEGRMLDCALGTTEDMQNWAFDLSRRTGATWKLFYLDENDGPVASADHLLVK